MREVGNSLRRTLLIWRWLGAGAGSASEFEAFSGVRAMDHASPLRKRTVDAVAAMLVFELVDVEVDGIGDGFDEITFPA